jgi:hypothetical protein
MLGYLDTEPLTRNVVEVKESLFCDYVVSAQ